MTSFNVTLMKSDMKLASFTTLHLVVCVEQLPGMQLPLELAAGDYFWILPHQFRAFSNSQGCCSCEQRQSLNTKTVSF